MMRPQRPYFRKLSKPTAISCALLVLVVLIVVTARGDFFADDSPPEPGRLAFSKIGWQTDFSLHTVPLEDINSAGPGKDGIPPLDAPTFVSVERADKWMEGENPVIAFEQNGDVLAYPLQILSWHEIVNDIVGGTPVTITFCPLCNSAVGFDRTLDGVVYDFGVTGNLRNSDLIMWDRQTESWWQQITGEAIVGELAGKQLTFIPAPIISWSDFMRYNPDGLVLSTDTGFDRNYRTSPYIGYDRLDRPPTNFGGTYERRLQPKERVAGVSVVMWTWHSHSRSWNKNASLTTPPEVKTSWRFSNQAPFQPWTGH